MGLIVTDFAGGDAYAPSVEKCVDIAEHFLGAGATSSVSTWGDYHTLVNPIMTSLGLSTISDGVTGATWLSRMNALNALGSFNDAYQALDSETDGFVLDTINDAVVVRDSSTPANNFVGTMAEALSNSILVYPSPSTKLIRDSGGAWQSGTALRCHYSTAGVALGLLSEPQRTNLLLNSASLATQSVTVSATAYTLSFEGTGTITLSGASTAGPLVGTGATDRVSLTFTPSAGSLTLTVSGTVAYSNLEAGSFRTSPIVTAGSTVTRNGDNLYVDVSKMPSNSNQWSVISTNRQLNDTSSAIVIGLVNSASPSYDNTLYVGGSPTYSSTLGVRSAASSVASLGVGTAAYDARARAATRLAADNYALSVGGAAVTTDTSGSFPTGVNRWVIGRAPWSASNYSVRPIESIVILPRLLSNAELQARSAL